MFYVRVILRRDGFFMLCELVLQPGDSIVTSKEHDFTLRKLYSGIALCLAAKPRLTNLG